MIDALSQVFQAAKGPRYLEVEPTAQIAVLRLSGSIGRGQAISERGVRQFVDTIGKAERLHLIINSGGGNVSEADGIYRILRSLPVPISAEVRMAAWSAAVRILLAADFRWARADASILIHRSRIEPAKWVRKGRSVTAADLNEQAGRLNTFDRAATDLLALRTGYRRDWFEREQATEDLMSERDALCSGLLHAIEGKVPFSLDNLTTLDKLAPPGCKPSESLTRNYRAAAAVAALT